MKHSRNSKNILNTTAVKDTNAQRTQFIENYIEKRELARRLSVSVSYINKLMKLNRIRFEKFGRAVRFKYSDVVADLQKRSLVT